MAATPKKPKSANMRLAGGHEACDKQAYVSSTALPSDCPALLVECLFSMMLLIGTQIQNKVGLNGK